jgi:NADH:ubiquinone oxidoreductase subunit 6 (subunit J)
MPAGGAQAAATSFWDVVRALLVVGALVFLTVFIVGHYGSDEKKAAAILAAVVPGLTAVVGAGLGHAAGKVAGRSAGRKSLAANMKTLLGDGGEEVPADPGAKLQQLREHLDLLESE